MRNRYKSESGTEKEERESEIGRQEGRKEGRKIRGREREIKRCLTPHCTVSNKTGRKLIPYVRKCTVISHNKHTYL